MHLNNYQNRHALLIDWLLASVPVGSSILDVGANDGSFCPEVRRIAAHAGLFAGVDPDVEKLDRNPFIRQRFPSTLEDSDIPDASFDCVYAIYVLEHVNDDRMFLKSVTRILKPGGSFFFITPNGGHYFAAIAGALAKMNLQEQVLRIIRPKELIGRYHYPALYRLNHVTKIQRLGREFGFSKTEFRYSENFSEFACYFPGPSKIFPWFWEKIIELSGREQLLGNLMGRLIKG